MLVRSSSDPRPGFLVSLEEKNIICMQINIAIESPSPPSCRLINPAEPENCQLWLSDEHADGQDADERASPLSCHGNYRIETDNQCHSTRPICHSTHEKSNTYRRRRPAHRCYHKCQSILRLLEPSGRHNSQVPLLAPSEQEP